MKFKIVSFFILFLFWSENIESQCPTEDIVFVNQDQVDSFAILYPECDSLNVQLRLSAPFNTITNLNGLSNLVYVKEIILFQVHAVKDLKGLEGLREVEMLFIGDCYELNSIDAINGLNKVQSLSIVNNSNLVEIAGLNSIDSLGSLGLIKKGDSFLNISGLNSLVHIESLGLGGNIEGEGLPGLISLEELNVLESSFSSLEQLLEFIPLVTELDNLQIGTAISLNGIEKLKKMNSLEINRISNEIDLSPLEKYQFSLGNLSISRCDLVESWESIGKLNITGSLTLFRNSNLLALPTFSEESELSEIHVQNHQLLSDISGISDLRNISFLNIRRNPNLEVCNYPSICRILMTDTLSALISNNAPGCNSIEEVQAQCMTNTYSHELNENLYISPNPVSHTLQIMGADQFETSWTEYGIFGINGQVLRSGALQDNSVNVSSLQPGMYFLVLSQNGQILPLKFVKE